MNLEINICQLKNKLIAVGESKTVSSWFALQGGSIIKSFVKLLILILVLIVLSACKRQTGNAESLEFYVLRNVEGTADFIMDKEPIFTGTDIKNYKWSKHIITFTDEFLDNHNDEEVIDSDKSLLGGSSLLQVFYPDQFALLLLFPSSVHQLLSKPA